MQSINFNQNRIVEPIFDIFASMLCKLYVIYSITFSNLSYPKETAF